MKIARNVLHAIIAEETQKAINERPSDPSQPCFGPFTPGAPGICSTGSPKQDAIGIYTRLKGLTKSYEKANVWALIKHYGKIRQLHTLRLEFQNYVYLDDRPSGYSACDDECDRARWEAASLVQWLKDDSMDEEASYISSRSHTPLETPIEQRARQELVYTAAKEQAAEKAAAAAADTKERAYRARFEKFWREKMRQQARNRPRSGGTSTATSSAATRLGRSTTR